MGKISRYFYMVLLFIAFITGCTGRFKDAAVLSNTGERLLSENSTPHDNPIDIKEEKDYYFGEQSRIRKEKAEAELLRVEKERAEAERLKMEQENAISASLQTVNLNIAAAAEGYVNNHNYSSSTSFLIWVNVGEQKVYVFQGANENWKLVRSMVCSTGSDATPTVTGAFSIRGRGDYFRVNESIICKYFTVFYGNYYFHSVLLDNSGNIVDGTLGKKASHGCIRLSIDDAFWINKYMPDDTVVVVN